MPMARREFLVSTAALAAGGSIACGVRSAWAAEAAPEGATVVVPPAPTNGLLFSCKYGMTQGSSLEERLAAARAAGMDGVDFDDAAAVTPEQLRRAAQQTVKLDIKGYSNAKADAEGKWKGFVDITAGDIDWAGVRAALREIDFTGWVSAEVGGGDVSRLKVVLDQMKRALVG